MAQARLTKTTKKPQVSLQKTLGFLNDSKHFGPVLEAVLARVTAVKPSKSGLTVEFGDDPAWLVDGRTIRVGKELALHSPGHLDFGAYGKGDPVFELFKASKNVTEVLFENFEIETVWVQHPTFKNPSGKPSLFAIAHELEDEIEPIVLNPGALFLHRVVTMNGWPIELPLLMSDEAEVVLPPSSSGWWSTLVWARDSKGNSLYHKDDGPLAQPFADRVLATVGEMQLEGLAALTDLPLKKLTALTRLTVIADQKKPLITSLKGLEACRSLEQLDLERHALTSVDDLAKLPKLRALRVSANKLTDVSALAKCTALEHLSLDGNKQLSDVSALTTLPRLESLRLQNTGAKNVLALAKLKSLEDLKVPSRFSKDDLAAFKKLRPKVEISW